MRNSYFQTYLNYFWRWEEAEELLAIPGGNTIAYKPVIAEIIQHLAPQGLPSFGAILLAVIATNPSAKESLLSVGKILKVQPVKHPDELEKALSFLSLLERLPSNYKSGNDRLLLLQAIFEKSHNRCSISQSMSAASAITTSQMVSGNDAKSLTLKELDFDLRQFTILYGRLKTTQDILNLIAGLPPKPEIVIPEEEQTISSTKNDLIDELLENEITFQAAALVKQLWSGLSIPIHTKVPSDQPIGGISDITNKGSFERLLISEFANDDLVFLNRLANNEALYIQREIPPNNNNQERIILIDVSLKNWGNPKTIAFAVMLALATHPKTDMVCTAYAIGYKYNRIQFNNVNDLIQGLQQLHHGLDSSNGLLSFFKDFPPSKDQEIMLITHKETLQRPEMLKAIHHFQTAIDYMIHPYEDGTIDVFKKQQHSKRHLQTLVLPLAEIWKKKPIKSQSQQQPQTQVASNTYSNHSACPILTYRSNKSSKLLFSDNGDVFCVSRDGIILRSFSKSARSLFKGWEILCSDFKGTITQAQIGKSTTGDTLLLVFNERLIVFNLFNVNTGELSQLPFTHPTKQKNHHIYFHYPLFYVALGKQLWTIDQQGTIQEAHELPVEMHEPEEESIKRITNSYSEGSPLHNIKLIDIDDKGQLHINNHRLTFIDQKLGLHFEYSKSKYQVNVRARQDLKSYLFEDGSKINIINPLILEFVSSNTEIPTFYLPAIIGTSLGMVTKNLFAGNKYYLKEPMYEVQEEYNSNESASALLSFYSYYSDYNYMNHNTTELIQSKKLKLSCVYSKSTIKQMEQFNGGANLANNNPSIKEKLLIESKDLNYDVIATSVFFQRFINKFIEHILISNETKY